MTAFRRHTPLSYRAIILINNFLIPAPIALSRWPLPWCRSRPGHGPRCAQPCELTSIGSCPLEAVGRKLAAAYRDYGNVSQG